MRILILTQYFPPETGAPQNRLFDLALKLNKKAERVDILTGFPNYPKYEIIEGYKGKWRVKEEMDGLNVYRSYIFVSSKKSLFYRLLNYFSFVISSFFAGIFRVPKVDLIICESPPLFLGITAVWLKWIKGAKLVFNVSDLWPESAVKLGLVTNPTVIKGTTWLEEWIYRKSDFISGQTQGIVNDIQKRFPNKPIFWLRNGVDPKELDGRLKGTNWRKQVGYLDDDILFYFGGLLGYAQALDTIVRAASILKDHEKIKFVIIGEGPEKERLVALKEELDAKQLTFFPGVSKSEIADIINAADVGIIPLKKIDLFLGAIPSKIFEIIYLKKPVLLGIEGEAKSLFVEQGKAGIAFEPENAEELAEKALELVEQKSLIAELGENGRTYVIEYFDREKIAKEFWNFINT